MRRLHREPLVHFLVLGAALVAASSFIPDRNIPRDDEIVVSTGQIEHLAARFARTWQRPPTLEELEGLVDEYVREEAAYREGIAIGLDSDDTIIRRRIRQKLDFIAEDVASLVEPTDEDLAEYLAAHPDDFRVDPRLTFVQVYLDPELRGDDLEIDAQQLLVTLNRDPSLEPHDLGDRSMLEQDLKDLSLREIGGLFGWEFAAAVETLQPTGSSDQVGSSAGEGSAGGSPSTATGQERWYGPIPSSFGLHLVRIDSRTEGRLPELAEIRDAVSREWENARRIEVKEQFYADLLSRYQIKVEWHDLDEQGSDQ